MEKYFAKFAILTGNKIFEMTKNAQNAYKKLIIPKSYRKVS